MLPHHPLRTAVDVCAELVLPLRLHAGFGDPGLTLHRADPSLLTDFTAPPSRAASRWCLPHGHPYHRQAAWRARAFPAGYTDSG
ncbi:hypothetical protein BG452_31040 [Streptomyces sp. CBMA123]|nr:hypothetical protein [Streptomyces sp. CBMA123]